MVRFVNTAKKRNNFNISKLDMDEIKQSGLIEVELQEAKTFIS